MKEIFEYYLSNCHQAIIHNDELCFDFGNYTVIFSFSEINTPDQEVEFFDNDFFSFNNLQDINGINELLEKNIEFISYKIKGYEYLGWREDETDVRSITNEMYFFLKKIKIFNRNVFAGASTFLDYGDDWGMCNAEANYCFEININNDYLENFEFAKYVINLFDLAKITVPDFYADFFIKKDYLSDNKIPPILSTNTKVRRLGYFKILSRFFDQNKKVPSSTIYKKFEDYSLMYKEALENNRFKKGAINKTKSGISAKPYIDTATDFIFLNKTNNIFNIGKPFKVYQILNSEYSSSPNIFELSHFDKMFFLEHILKNDFFYFSNLLEIFFLEEKIPYSTLIEIYQKQLIIRLEEYKQLNNSNNRIVLNNLDTILKRVNSWEKPEIYLEHLLMPRINWMLDLGIIEGNNNLFTITEQGFKLFEHLSIWNDINTDKIVSPDSFLDRFMIHVYDDCFNNRKSSPPFDINFIIEKVYTYINRSFDLFKTLAPNRVTASQAANYAKYKLYLDENIAVGYQFILNKLSEKEQDRYIFKYQEQYKDGYIQRKN